MNNTDIYLASSSARRYEILKLMGISKLHTVSSNIDEVQLRGETPLEYSIRVSIEKATVAKSKIATPGAIIIAADTEVIINNEILGKPVDYNHAFDILQKLRNNTHQVISTVVLLKSDIELTNTQINNITIDDYSDAEIAHYLAHNTYLDKSGSYGIQGIFSKYVSKIDGDFYSIMGLSMHATHNLLKEVGYEYI